MDPEPISTLTSSSIDIYVVIQALALIGLLISSALVSGAEVAFFSLTKTNLEEIGKSNSVKGNIVIDLLDRPKKLLATILIANNFINILIVLLFASLGTVFLADISENIRFLIEVVLITFLILLFGEVLPKVYATRNADAFSKNMSRAILLLSHLLAPLSSLLTGLTGIVENRLGKKNSGFSVERLSQAFELTSDAATTKDEKNILEGIVAFGNTETVQVMKPRIDVFAIADDEPFLGVLDKIVENGYSRNPVYHENIDEIIGVLYAKDLLPHITKKEFNWQTLIRAPYFVPENKKLDDLLVDFQEKKNHLAIVVDEYGGTSGLVTLEDVIEEIVGDISDEYANDYLSYSKLDQFNYIFEGKTTLKDFYRVLDISDTKFEEQKGESETLAGFILEISGKFPKKQEKITFENYLFTIESVDRKRLKRLKVTILGNAVS
ncbi:gliding motility-associated protein GldE [Flavicella sediminum]|uniref:gliding motility-associated protein GldE n=1 Tax=Flavicella sediminum TaxID=2585141 RepID=UPI00112144DC|nr:gliding motility-associated protein GldE [Flavicella sediminum]